MDVPVVDDERPLRSALRRALTLEGYRVLESESGERALETLRERTVDAAILDVLRIRFPDANGSGPAVE